MFFMSNYLYIFTTTMKFDVTKDVVCIKDCQRTIKTIRLLCVHFNVSRVWYYLALSYSRRYCKTPHLSKAMLSTFVRNRLIRFRYYLSYIRFFFFIVSPEDGRPTGWNTYRTYVDNILLRINALSWTALICVCSSFTDCHCKSAVHSKTLLNLFLLIGDGDCATFIALIRADWHGHRHVSELRVVGWQIMVVSRITCVACSESLINL